MANQIITIPHRVMRVLNCNWQIDWRTQGSGEGLDGNEQLFIAPFPRWIGAPSLTLHGEALRAWRATRSRARGRVNLYRVPMIDADGLPSAHGMSDTSGRPLDGAYGDGPTATVAAAAVIGATQLVITERFWPARVGAMISIADWPYIVVDRVAQGADCRLTVEMPLRRAVTVGSVVNLVAHGVFRAADDLMGNPNVGPDGFSSVDMSFQEWLGPGRP